MLDYAGVRGAELTEAQRKQLLELVALYVDNMDDGPRAGEDGRGAAAPRPHVVRLDRQDRAGRRVLLPHPQPGDPDRVRSPGAGEPEAATRKIRTRPIREHIHTVVRTPNGNDYGKDLLRQHYLQHPHTTAGNLR